MRSFYLLFLSFFSLFCFSSCSRPPSFSKKSFLANDSLLTLHNNHKKVHLQENQITYKKNFNDWKKNHKKLVLALCESLEKRKDFYQKIINALKEMYTCLRVPLRFELQTILLRYQHLAKTLLQKTINSTQKTSLEVRLKNLKINLTKSFPPSSKNIPILFEKKEVSLKH